jgi:alcohol dehydrogenase class IV
MIHRGAYGTRMTESTDHPLSGCWKPTPLESLYYGSGSVQKHLLPCLPSSDSKAFIITGSSLAQKTPLVKQVEDLLGKEHHAGTFANIKQHAPVAQLDEATDAVFQDSTIDTLISIGGGSPIDSAKAISYRVHEKSGTFLHHISIPTTLSAAECTSGAGYTRQDGTKIGVADRQLAPNTIIYDAGFGMHTPQKLWLSSAIRALDHTVELLYHPTAAEVPAKQLVLTALASLFEYLPKSKREPQNEDFITQLQLAAFSSLYPLGMNVKGGIGLSHALGYALGSPYGIPHGITSCLTLASVVRLKADNPGEAAQIARALPFTGKGSRSGHDREDALKVGDAIEELVDGLGLGSRLAEYGVGEDQVEKIAKTATKTENGQLYDGVVRLLRSKL